MLSLGAGTGFAIGAAFPVPNVDAMTPQPEPGTPLGFKGPGSLLGLWAMLTGLVTLLGWAAGWYRLTDWQGSGISMKPNAALVAVVGGLAILHLHRGWPSPWLVRVMGAFVAGIGGL